MATVDKDFKVKHGLSVTEGGNVRLLVTASDETTVKVHKTLIEA